MKIFILDTSAILSGKPIDFDNVKIFTTPNVSKELSPGGRDYQTFQFLQEKGLVIQLPSKKSAEEIKNISKNIGEGNRLSDTDKEILALALDFKKNGEDAIILTDDYSIQNIASILKIEFEGISQKGITKKFKWIQQCQGCRKKYKDNIKICPICGAKTKSIITKKKDIKRHCGN